MRFPPYQNQGHMVVSGWDNVPTLKNWTAYIGTDGERFLPPYDRDGYTSGVTRRMNTGGILRSGFPIAKLTFPAITDGQIDYLITTLGGGSVSSNVTVAIHAVPSVGVNDVSNFNAVMNIDTDQITTLQRKEDAYVGFVVEFVLVEAL